MIQLIPDLQISSWFICFYDEIHQGYKLGYRLYSYSRNGLYHSCFCHINGVIRSKVQLTFFFLFFFFFFFWGGGGGGGLGTINDHSTSLKHISF